MPRNDRNRQQVPLTHHTRPPDRLAPVLVLLRQQIIEALLSLVQRLAQALIFLLELRHLE